MPAQVDRRVTARAALRLTFVWNQMCAQNEHPKWKKQHHAFTDPFRPPAGKEMVREQWSSAQMTWGGILTKKFLRGSEFFQSLVKLFHRVQQR
jgi:hypothetical protein